MSGKNYIRYCRPLIIYHIPNLTDLYSAINRYQRNDTEAGCEWYAIGILLGPSSRRKNVLSETMNLDAALAFGRMFFVALSQQKKIHARSQYRPPETWGLIITCGRAKTLFYIGMQRYRPNRSMADKNLWAWFISWNFISCRRPRHVLRVNDRPHGGLQRTDVSHADAPRRCGRPTTIDVKSSDVDWKRYKSHF